MGSLLKSVGKSVGTIGGGILGGVFGGPAGALVGSALGSSIGGVGENRASIGSPLDARALAGQGGFTGNIGTSAYTFNQSGLFPNDQSRTAQFTNLANYGIENPLQIRSNLTGLRGELQGLRGQFRPGFGRLTQARTQAIKDAGAESVGNLRESLARRNVLGSSFANDAISRETMAVGREVERASAEAMVQEFGAQLQSMAAELGLDAEERALFGQQAQSIVQRASLLGNQMDRELQELAVAGNIRNGINAQVSAQAMQLAQLQMLQQQGNAGISGQNAGNQADYAGLMAAGTMGLFGNGGALAGWNPFKTSTVGSFNNNTFGSHPFLA